jgi:osomolarity two-component system sensor histidine kinase TcsA
MVSRIQLPDDSSLRANHYETKSLATSEAPLEKIFIFTPVPTIVLDSSLRICQVSDGHLSLAQLSRGDIVGCSMFDVPLSTIPVCSLPLALWQ